MGKCLITNNIRKLRFNANEMTQQELADKTGVTRQTMVAIENGKYGSASRETSIKAFLASLASHVETIAAIQED